MRMKTDSRDAVAAQVEIKDSGFEYEENSGEIHGNCMFETLVGSPLLEKTITKNVLHIRTSFSAHVVRRRAGSASIPSW